MTTYLIKLKGCAEVTQFMMDLDDSEAGVIGRVAAQSREHSSYECYPVMTIERRPCEAHPDDCPLGPEPHAFVPPAETGPCCCRQPWELTP